MNNMNYVFISPAYPVTCTHFCSQLSRLGVTVLGIGDVPYDDLNGQLKNALTEYYYVDSLEDYDQVYRAVAFFIHNYRSDIRWTFETALHNITRQKSVTTIF